MRLTDILLADPIFETYTQDTDPNLLIIRESCSSFLADSLGMPLYKVQPATIDTFRRVKVRQRKDVDVVTEAFNSAFVDMAHSIRQRSIIVESMPPTITTPNTVPVYVFPVNKFNFLYSTTVKNSAEVYDQLYETLCVNDIETQSAMTIVVDLIRSTYTNDSLVEGIMSGSEIIIYNIPAYFTIRADLYEDYDALYDAIITSQ